jgi:hypothetical protein
MKTVLICFEMPFPKGTIAGHQTTDMPSFSRISLEQWAQKTSQELVAAMGDQPVGQLVIRSATLLEEDTPIQ